jgi:crossover junction endodeoxyribonuclease RusA
MFACNGGFIPRPFAVRVEVCCFFARPKHTNKKIQCKTTKPDVDKLLRAVLDGLTGIAFDDDSQVVDARVFKYFGSPERVEIAFEETPYES